MKKKFAGILVALMVLAMGTTVFGATSPDASDVLQQKAQQLRDSVSDVQCQDAELTISTVSETALTEANTKATEKYSDAQVLAMVEVTPKAGTDVSKGVTVTFYVSGIAKGDNVRLLHQLSDGNWEVISPVVGNGYVTATFYSFSPVAIVKYAEDQVIPPTQQIPESATQTPNGDGNQNHDQSNNQTTDQTNDQANDNNQNNDQANNNDQTNDQANQQTNQVTQTNNNYQTVTITLPDGTIAAGAGVTTGTTSPKTGDALPVFPIIAVLALAGLAVCGKKALSL